MRINRYIARAGIASRRAAERLVRDGRVTLNGERVSELSTLVGAGDLVEVDGRRISIPSSLTYVLLNKPAGHVVTLRDPRGRPTAADLVRDVGTRLIPVGRLDAPTEGLIIFTDDGELAHRVAHPSFELDKVYEVVALGMLDEDDVRTLEQGIVLDGRATSPARVEILSARSDATRALITIHEGRKRQVRRMFEAIAHPVEDLRRVRIGPLELGSLRPGRWRHMTEEEVDALFDAVGLERG